MIFALALSAAAMPKAMPYMTYASANYGSTQLEDYARQVAGIVNRERAANGLSPLKYSDRLSEPALVRAKEIQSSFSHTRPNGSKCFTAITEAGITYRTAGENIAYGQRNPEEVMNAWMNSSGHRANILGANYEYIGIGVTYQNGIYYWSQFFAASSDLSGEVITLGGSATQATTKATAATTQATQATTKATAATTQATQATTKATAATTQATQATTKATAATTQATQATTKATAATTQATQATTKATVATTQATQATTKQTAATTQATQVTQPADNDAVRQNNSTRVWVLELINILRERYGKNC